MPTDEGLYRISHSDYDGFVYVGETGRSLRGRVRSLARGTFDDEMPYRDPHTAAPCLWAIRDQHGPNLRVSWTNPRQARDSQQRKAIEAALIALHRREHRQSPTANFGRIISGYKQSSYREDGVVGGPLSEDDVEPNAEPGIGPFDWDQSRTPTSASWMGLSWRESEPLSDAYQQIPKESGLYRLWYSDDPLPLEYIGQSANLRNRLYRHRRQRDGDLQFSFAPTPELDAGHMLQEVETDLLGAHWLACDMAPTDQF